MGQPGGDLMGVSRPPLPDRFTPVVRQFGAVCDTESVTYWDRRVDWWVRNVVVSAFVNHSFDIRRHNDS